MGYQFSAHCWKAHCWKLSSFINLLNWTFITLLLLFSRKNTSDSISENWVGGGRINWGQGVHCWWPVHSPPENSARKVPPRLFPPEHSPLTKLGFAKYAVNANLFPPESSILTRAKRAKSRNNAAINWINIRFFQGGNLPWGVFTRGEITGVKFSGGQYT